MRVSRISALLAIAAFLSLVNVSSAADPPSGESLLQLSIDKSGGAEAYAGNIRRLRGEDAPRSDG